MSSRDKHPLQPLYVDENNVIRFKENAIVRFLLDAGTYNLNTLALMPFERNDWEQFAQLIGYPLDGFAELSYVSDKTYAKAARKAQCLKNKNKDHRIKTLEAKIKELESQLETCCNELAHYVGADYEERKQDD